MNIPPARYPNRTAPADFGSLFTAANTIEEEREFLAQWVGKATIGGVLTVPPIHAALVERLGRDIPLS
ncbi:MAG: hypothetical protein PHI99_10050, partial [Syntrophales bacterium]|nr:hypothetical protein [Syntrophales bacterium]